LYKVDAGFIRLTPWIGFAILLLLKLIWEGRLSHCELILGFNFQAKKPG